MTEKIIIDGVDVSGCKKYEHEIVRCNATLKNMCFCGGRCTDKKNADCYFKQLKRKEQKCEELKKQHQGDKGLITSTGKMNYQLLQEYDKLKTALTEIKEIAENQRRYIDDIKGFMFDDKIVEWESAYIDFSTACRRLNQEILQKISEVEND